MFSTKHCVILAVCCLYIAAVLFFLCKKKPKLITVVRCLGLIGVISETLKLCTYIVANEATYGGYLPKTDLPFHLCSLQLFFIAAILLTKNEKTQRVAYAFMMPSCLIGGIGALLIPTYSSLNMPMITVQYYLYHASILIFALYLIISREMIFTLKDFAHCLIVLWAVFFLAIYLNSWVNDYEHAVNFMYVVNPPVNGLPFLNKDKGWLVYILRYAGTAVLCITLCYAGPIVRCLRKQER